MELDISLSATLNHFAWNWIVYCYSGILPIPFTFPGGRACFGFYNSVHYWLSTYSTFWVSLFRYGNTKEIPNMLICIDLLTLMLHLKVRQSLLFSTWTIIILFNLSDSMIIHAKHHENWIGNLSNDPRRIWYTFMLLFQWGNIIYMRRFCNDFPPGYQW